MADTSPRRNAPVEAGSAPAEADSTAQPAPPPVTVERVGAEAVILRFSLKDGALDLPGEDDEPLGGDAACWAHLFEDDAESPPR